MSTRHDALGRAQPVPVVFQQNAVGGGGVGGRRERKEGWIEELVMKVVKDRRLFNTSPRS